MQYPYDQLEMKDGFILPSYQQRLGKLVKTVYQSDDVLVEASNNYTTEGINRKLNPETIQLLEEWKHLKKKRPSKCEGKNKQSFFQNQLTQLIEPRAIPFLVFEHLSKWDPQGRLQNWTKNYKSQICDLPDLESYSPVLLPEKARQRYSGEYKKELEFTRYVAAACAEYCGLWCERNALQDISFIGAEYHLAQTIIKQCKDPDVKEKSIKSLQHIVNIFSSFEINDLESIEWKWRHIASMRLKLGDIHPHYIRANLWRIGFVVICCKSIESCYQLLGHLHAHESISNLDEHFSDFIGNPPPSGYKAIHTIVDFKEDNTKNRIHVRFIVKEKGAQETWKKALEKHMQEKRLPKKNKTIRVFTPRGNFCDLPISSTVLDFASHLHDSFVGKTKFAVINNSKRLNLLDQLTDGDEIALMVNDDYDLLPDGWNNVVTSKVKHIRRKLKNNMAMRFEKKAHTRIARLIPQYTHLTGEVRDLVLQAVVSEANDIIFNSQSSSHKADLFNVQRWLNELGIKEEKENYKYKNYPFRSDIDNYKERIFIHSLKGWVSSATHFPKTDIIAKNIRKNKLGISICKICTPTRHCERVIKVEGENLVFHLKGAKCGVGGKVVQTKLRATVGQYFIFEISGEINGDDGILSQILNILHNMGVTVTEVIGKHLGLDWGVIRIEVGLVSTDMITIVQKKLKDLDSIQRILGPNDPKTPILESALPPRNDINMQHAMIPAPYTCGGVVKQDHDFYNRNEELGELQLSFDYQTVSTFAGGKVFISGPLKTGKTSLAYKFQRILKQQIDNILPLIVYYQAKTRDNWSDVENELTQGLKDQIKEHYMGQDYFQSPDLKNNQLEEILEVSGKTTHNGKRIVSVLIVDEVLIPFRRAHDAAIKGDSQELENIKQFAGVIHNKPGTLLIWIGPKAPVNSLNIDLQNTLRAGEQVEVRPFSRFHTKELLRVNQLRWKYRININNHITNHLWKITDGNPFWLNHFGRKMWEQASQNVTTGEMVQFTAEDVRTARDEILANDILFSDRIFPEGYYNKDQLHESVKCILELLFERKKEKGKNWAKIWITLDEVIAAINSKSPLEQATPQTVKEVFYDLVAMGGFNQKNNQIRISAPLLADWIQIKKII